MASGRNGHLITVIGSLRSVVLDCPDPHALAAFYAAVIGGTVEVDGEPDDGTWVVLRDPSGRRLAFQLAPDYLPPEFPDPRGSQQFHLDVGIAAADADAADERVVALGATRIEGDGGRGADFRVYRDPAGHPFCLVLLPG